jgi:hypothetical protein
MIDIIFTRKNSTIISDDRDSRGGTIELEVFKEALLEKLITLHEAMEKNSMLIELNNVFMELVGAWAKSLQHNILSAEIKYTTVTIVYDQCIPANTEEVRKYLVCQKLENL